MLVNLYINNIVLIESQNLEFNKGLCVITGDTGAGKSIILNSIKFVLGKKINANLVRNGSDKGIVIAEFDISKNEKVRNILDENAIEHDNVILIKRVIYQDGKSKAFINDIAVTIALLTDVSDNLLEIHGQHEQKGLLDSKNHRTIIDEYGNFTKELSEVSIAFEEFKSIEKQIEIVRNDIENISKQKDYLLYLVDELTKLNPKENEDEDLLEKKKFISDKVKITDALNLLISEFKNNNILESLYSLQRKIVKSRNIDTLSNLLDNSSEIIDKNINDLEEILVSYEKELLNYDLEEYNLESIENRLFELRDIARKYNTPISELTSLRDKSAELLNNIENSDDLLKNLNIQLEQAKANYLKKADTLSEKRKNIAKIFENKIAEELRPLHMQNIVLVVKFEQVSQQEWSKFGYDKITFLVSTNLGVPPDAINKISSGGELSRFMLALKVVLSEMSSVSTMIFDEIDTGTSGAVADAIGRKLKLLSTKDMQVITVTHQAQIAAYSNSHFKVVKRSENNLTNSFVYKLNQDERLKEIARILSGSEITEEAINAASKLVSSSS